MTIFWTTQPVFKDKWKAVCLTEAECCIWHPPLLCGVGYSMWQEKACYHCGKLRSCYKLATVVEGDPKDPFSIATIPRCRGGSYSFPGIAPPYPWYVPYIAKCKARIYQVPFLKSLVWHNLGLNPGLLDYWRALYPIGQWKSKPVWLKLMPDREWPGQKLYSPAQSQIFGPPILEFDFWISRNEKYQFCHWVRKTKEPVPFFVILY